MAERDETPSAPAAKSGVPTAPAAPAAPEAAAAPPAAAEEIEVEPLFPAGGYVLLNLLFWGFCAVEIVLIRLWLGDIQGVIFFFVLLSIGFTAVSVYDAVYDRIRVRARERQLQAAAGQARG